MFSARRIAMKLISATFCLAAICSVGVGAQSSERKTKTKVKVDGGTEMTVGRWIPEREARHLAELTFPEGSGALRALSSAYVERRAKLADGAALSGAGKRAAFALFYAPLHYLSIAHIVRHLPGATDPIPTLV